MTRKLLRKTAVAARYGYITERTVDRWTADPEMKFPQPIYVGASPLWDEQELEEWERTHAPRRALRRIETFRYVPHSDVPKLMAEGWQPLPALEGTHHGEYSTLMQLRQGKTRAA